MSKIVRQLIVSRRRPQQHTIKYIKVILVVLRVHSPHPIPTQVHVLLMLQIV